MEKSLLKIISDAFVAHFNESGWGDSIFIMGKSGESFCRMYQYANDDESIVFDSLSVDPASRKEGIGTALLDLAYELGKAAGAKRIYLQVVKETWVHDWYARKGYTHFKDNENDKTKVWLYKPID